MDYFTHLDDNLNPVYPYIREEGFCPVFFDKFSYCDEWAAFTERETATYVPETRCGSEAEARALWEEHKHNHKENAMASNRHPDITKLSLTLIGKTMKDLVPSIDGGHDFKCPFCGTEFSNSDLKDDLSKAEARISSMCQACQDKTFIKG